MMEMLSEDKMSLLIIIIVLVLYLEYQFSGRISRNFYKRISTVSDLPSNVEGIKLKGKITFVCDGDGFQFFHVPIFKSSEYTKNDKKLNIRLAGIDAPEGPYNGNLGQPYFKEAKETLKRLVWNKSVTLKLLDVDQYNRLLATCFVQKGIWLWNQETVNVNLEMVKLGLACVYTCKDAIYDDYEEDLTKSENEAQQKRIGVWSLPNYESPFNYRMKHRKGIEGHASVGF